MKWHLTFNENNLSQLITPNTKLFLIKYKNYIKPLSTNPTKWSNTLKQFVGNMATNCLSVFDHFVWLLFKRYQNTSLTGIIKTSIKTRY